MKYESPFNTPVMEGEFWELSDPYDAVAAEYCLKVAEGFKKESASYALYIAQALDAATEAYGSLTMALQSDPVPCLGYISSGMAALSWILENAELEELAAIAERVNDAMTDMERVADNLKTKHDIEKGWNQWNTTGNNQ